MGHPKAAKVALAKEIVARFHGAQAADAAHAEFERLFGAGKRSEIPEDAPSFTLRHNGAAMPLAKLLVEIALCDSSNGARRQIIQNAVSVDGEKIVDPKAALEKGTHTLRVGKKRWARLTIE